MTRTKKGFLAGFIVLAMVLALAFGFGLVPSPHETAYADFSALSNVQLVGNTLSWDAFTGATKYQVEMIGLGGNGSKSYTTNSADLSAIAAYYHCETDTYDWYVYAVDEHDNQISLASTSNADYSTDPDYDYNVSYAKYSYTNTQTRLSTPTGLVWNHTTLMWDDVEGARSYSLTVYEEEGDVFVTQTNIFSGTSYSWTGFQTDTSYYFTIQANAPFGGDDCDSLVATSGTHTFASVVADLGSHVSISANGQLSISDVEGLDNCSFSIWSSDRTSEHFGGCNNVELPLDLYTEFAILTVPDGTYDIEIEVYNEYNEPLAPVYYYDDWVYDSSLAPQVLTGTVTVTGDLEYGDTLTATVTDTNNTGTLNYRWYRSDPLEDWVILQNGTSNTVTLTKPCIGKSILVVVTSSVELNQIQSAETDTVGAGAAAVEIVSVGGNPVSAELGPGEFTNGSFPMGHVGTPYSAQLTAEGGSGNYTWEVIVGSLASGLSLNSSTGLVSGTPTNTATGSITIKCTDADNTDFSDNVQLNFVVYADSWVPSIVTTTVDNAVVDQSYDFDLVVNSESSASIDWTVESGSLPTGLSLGNSGTWNGRLYGTPTTKGTYTFTLKAANNVGSDTQEYTIVVDELLTVSYVDAKYYLGDEVALTASVGNANVDWSIGHNTSAATVISSSGVLTIGADEAATYIAVHATSKTNSNNVGQVLVYFTPKTAYSVTVTGGTATDSLDNPIARAAEDEDVYISAPELTGKEFREWTVEAGSAAVALADATGDHTYFSMPAGNVILKANYDTIIDSVSATFDAPINGQHIDQTLLAGSPNYTATLMGVWQGTGFKSLTDTIYETGKEYTFFVQFAPASGYVIVPNNQLSVTLNGTALSYEDDYNFIQSAWKLALTAVSDEIPHFAVTVTNGIASASLAQENDVITITANAPSAGFVFDKWTTEDGVTFASETSVSTTFVMPAKAVAVSATYKAIPQYTVTFGAGEGTGSMASELVNENDKFELPANLFVAPANKEFKCWSVGGVEKNVGDEITITADTTVTAVWQYIKVAVSFDAGEGTGSMAPQQVDKGSSYTLPANGFTAPDGKRFKSWSIGGNAVAAGASIIINNATTVTAVWENLPTMHAVSFDANGGTGSKAAEQVEHGTYFTLPESPFTAPTGKVFAGWAFTANGSKIEAATIQVNNDVTLFALWKDVATEPSQPTQPDEPSQPSQPTQPAEPSQPDTPASPTEPSISEDKGGLSGGAIAGIVVGSVAVAGIGGFAFLWFVIKKKKFADLIAIFKKK